MEARQVVLAIDLGGTRFRTAVVDESGQLSYRLSQLTEVHRGRIDVIERMIADARHVLAQLGSTAVQGVGIAAPGPVDPWTGVIYNPPNMRDWDEVPLKHIFEEALRLPVHVGNDANLAGLGEHRFGAGWKADHLVYITVSTGIGGGIIDRGRLLLGARGLAGEIGHMTIDPAGPRCGCGNRGCLEALASGTSIARIAREAAAAEPNGLMMGLVDGRLDRLTTEVVVQAAQRGDTRAGEILDRAGRYLGIGIANLLALFNPEMVILGGGVINAGDLIFSPIRREVEMRAMPKIRDGVEIVRAALGDDVGLLGAAALVFAEAGRRPA